MNPQALMYDSLYEPISSQSSVSQYKPNFGLGGPSSHYEDNFGPCSKVCFLDIFYCNFFSGKFQN